MQLCSQESGASSASFAAFPSSHSAARTPAPRTPFSQDQSCQASLTPPAPNASGSEGCHSNSRSPSPSDMPSTPQGGSAAAAVAADEHMLPLQHLLMSERARHLTALEVKAIVFKVRPCSRCVLCAACSRMEGPTPIPGGAWQPRRCVCPCLHVRSCPPQLPHYSAHSSNQPPFALPSLPHNTGGCRPGIPARCGRPAPPRHHRLCGAGPHRQLGHRAPHGPSIQRGGRADVSNVVSGYLGSVLLGTGCQ